MNGDDDDDNDDDDDDDDEDIIIQCSHTNIGKIYFDIHRGNSDKYIVTMSEEKGLERIQVSISCKYDEEKILEDIYFILNEIYFEAKSKVEKPMTKTQYLENSEKIQKILDKVK